MPKSFEFNKKRSIKGLKLKISPNGRHFVDQYGEPFFYLGDTAWRLFKELNREEVDEYLENRAAKGFTVIQAYVLRGLNVKNIYGDLPLINNDPAQPNEAFFKNIDFIVDRAEELGMFMGLVTTYGEHVRRDESKSEVFRNNESVFTLENAFAYGKFLGARYKDKPVIWLFGGDRNPVGSEDIWRAIAAGLKEGFKEGQLISYHGPGDPDTPSSSFWFHNEDWLGFNTIQSGHGWCVPNYKYVFGDYKRLPAKPTIDMEPSYENSQDVKYKSDRRIDAHRVREGAYWAMLSGAAGHGYGCCGIWEFNSDKLPPDYTFNYTMWRGTEDWHIAMDYQGAFCVGIMRKLFELRPWYKMAPDQSVIAGGQGEGEHHIQAARAEDGSFAIAYLPLGEPVEIHMDKIIGAKVKAQWYNPRNGEFLKIGTHPNEGIRAFKVPSGEGSEDWVLVLDAAGFGYRNE